MLIATIIIWIATLAIKFVQLIFCVILFVFNALLWISKKIIYLIKFVVGCIIDFFEITIFGTMALVRWIKDRWYKHKVKKSKKELALKEGDNNG